jgi:hypothetical protein
VKVNKRGAVGERGTIGPRLPKYQYRVNGTILSDNKLSAIVTFLKAKVKSVKEVREAIKAQLPDFDWENPPATFEFNIAGAHVQAEKLMDDSPDDDSDDGEEEIEGLVTETTEEEGNATPLFFDDTPDDE